MVCIGSLRSLVAGRKILVGLSSCGRVHFKGWRRDIDVQVGLSHPWNCPRLWTRSLKMMVDSAASVEPLVVVNVVSSEKHQTATDGGFASGGWKSDDGRLSCGYSSFKGRRATMEDFYDLKTYKIDGQSISLFGIFDGHGGSRAAEYLKDHLFENLMKHPQFMTEPKLAISETYKRTDADFLESERNTFRDDGSTASTAILIGNHLYVANVGDSRTVILKAGNGAS